MENAVHHGLRPKGGAGLIVIGAAEEGGQLVLSVPDNGVGMPREKIREDGSGTGFGLRSVCRRVRLCYGGSGTVAVESRSGEWTKVTVRIPMEKREKDENTEGPDCR